MCGCCDFGLYVLPCLGAFPSPQICIVYSSENRKGHTWNVVKDTTGRYVGFWFTERGRIRDSVYSDLRKSGKVSAQLLWQSAGGGCKIFGRTNGFLHSLKTYTARMYRQIIIRIRYGCGCGEDYVQVCFLGSIQSLWLDRY